VGHLLYNNEAIGPGAQTSRPDDAGPVRRLLGGMASPAAFFFLFLQMQKGFLLCTGG
jgi:hypothetical protein